MSKTLPQRRDHTGNRTSDRAEQAREELAQVLRFCPFVVGKLVSVTFPAATRKVVRHGLGARAACFVVRQNYDAAAGYVVLAESADQVTGVVATQQLAMISNVACSVDLWFYPRASKDIDAGQGQSL